MVVRFGKSVLALSIAALALLGGCKKRVEEPAPVQPETTVPQAAPQPSTPPEEATPATTAPTTAPTPATQ